MKTTKAYQKTGRKRNEEEDLPGYPEYSEDEDIYRQGKEEGDIDPENVHRKKERIDEDNTDDESDHSLDIPGSELDDDLEDVGSEDEENNYYSLSDDHADDLEDLI